MATMQDVADLAGVSISTVSFIVNDTKPVSEATRARVEAAMHELRYRRNPVGSALAKGRTRIIALLYPALQRRLDGTAVEFFRSAAERAEQRGYSLILWPVSNEAEPISDLVSTGLVDGVLLMEVQLADARVEALRTLTTPFALIGRTQDPSDLAHVDIDFERSVEIALDELVTLGHTRFAFVDRHSGHTSVPGLGAHARARSSFLELTTENGLTGVHLTSAENSSAGRSLASTFRQLHPDVTAVLMLNEHAAPGFVAGLGHAGVDIPGEISVISIGTSPYMAQMADPELTFMNSPGTELGRLGVDAIIERIEHPENPLPQVLLPCIMTPGATLAPPPGTVTP